MVRGASDLAERHGVSPLVVGLTVVAFGTSAPELVINIIGALQGQTALAFGNIAGSNLANFGLVLGCAAVISPIALEGKIIRRELPLLLLATAVLFIRKLDNTKSFCNTSNYRLVDLIPITKHNRFEKTV